LLIEKYAGAMPTWLAPTQVKLLPIGSNQHEYTKGIYTKLRQAGIRCEMDERNEKIGYKIREAQLEKIPYMLVCGEKEQTENMLSVRSRKEGDIGVMSADEFLTKLLKEIAEKAR